MSDNQQSSLALVREAFSEGPSRAENQLMLIGREGGDEALVLVTQNLSAAEIFALAAQGDITKSSVAQAFATPEQFSEAFSYFGSRYGQGGDVHVLLRDLVDFIHPFFFEGDDKLRKRRVEAFIKHRLGMKTLCTIGLLDPEFYGFFSRDVVVGHVSHGTWQDILLYVKEVHPSAFARVREWAFRMFPKGPDHNRASGFLEGLQNELLKEAREKVGGDGVAASPKPTFVDF